MTALALSATPPALAQDGPRPDILTIQEAGQTLEEYRIDGTLYAIRIVPQNGKAYFLVDTTGNGNFERVERAAVEVPAWVRDD